MRLGFHLGSANQREYTPNSWFGDFLSGAVNRFRHLAVQLISSAFGKEIL
jgi:hypothetical protein